MAKVLTCGLLMAKVLTCGLLMAKVQTCSLKVSELRIQLYYYISIQTNTLRKGMNPLIPP